MSSRSVGSLLYRSLLKLAHKFDSNVGAKKSLLRAVYHRESPALLSAAALSFSVEHHVKARFRPSKLSLSEGFATLRLFSSMYSYCCLWTSVLDKHREDTSMKNGAIAIAQIIDPNFNSASWQKKLDSLIRRVQSVINNPASLEEKSDVLKHLDAITQVIFSEEGMIREIKSLSRLNLRAAALCTVYQAVASGVGVKLDPCESSGYFALMYQPAQGESLIIDAYKGGKITENDSSRKWKRLDGRAANLKLIKLIDSVIPPSKNVKFATYALMYAPNAIEGRLESGQGKDTIENKTEKENRKKKENVVKRQETLATKKEGG